MVAVQAVGPRGGVGVGVGDALIGALPGPGRQRDLKGLWGGQELAPGSFSSHFFPSLPCAPEPQTLNKYGRQAPPPEFPVEGVTVQEETPTPQAPSQRDWEGETSARIWAGRVTGHTTRTAWPTRVSRQTLEMRGGRQERHTSHEATSWWASTSTRLRCTKRLPALRGLTPTCRSRTP